MVDVIDSVGDWDKAGDNCSPNGTSIGKSRKCHHRISIGAT